MAIGDSGRLCLFCFPLLLAKLSGVITFNNYLPVRVTPSSISLSLMYIFRYITKHDVWVSDVNPFWAISYLESSGFLVSGGRARDSSVWDWDELSHPFVPLSSPVSLNISLFVCLRNRKSSFIALLKKQK